MLSIKFVLCAVDCGEIILDGEDDSRLVLKMKNGENKPFRAHILSTNLLTVLFIRYNICTCSETPYIFCICIYWNKAIGLCLKGQRSGH